MIFFVTLLLWINILHLQRNTDTKRRKTYTINLQYWFHFKLSGKQEEN